MCFQENTLWTATGGKNSSEECVAEIRIGSDDGLGVMNSPPAVGVERSDFADSKNQ